MSQPLILLDVKRLLRIFRDLFSNRPFHTIQWTTGAAETEIISVLIYNDRERTFRLTCVEPSGNRAPYVEFALNQPDGRLIVLVVCAERKDDWVVTFGHERTPGVKALKDKIPEGAPVSMKIATTFVGKVAGMMH